jgi:hypothetical protein
LAGDHVADSAEQDAGDGADEGNGGQARETNSFETLDCGAKEEGQSEGEGERDEQLAREVKDKDENREQEERLTPGELGWSSTGH